MRSVVNNLKKVIFLLFIIATVLQYGCFAPINLCFENAKLLKKGEIKAQANVAGYFATSLQKILESDNSMENYNNNVGVGLNYGISDKINAGLRYERIGVVSDEVEFFGMEFNTGIKAINFLELSNKIRLYEDKLALAFPVSFYFLEEDGFFSFDPRLYWTIRENNKFEATFTPKLHVFFGESAGVAPGLTLGIGLSDNLDKWAIRPEIGYDGFFSIGLGFNAYMNSK